MPCSLEQIQIQAAFLSSEALPFQEAIFAGSSGEEQPQILRLRLAQNRAKLCSG
jgi:hypothetical protein